MLYLARMHSVKVTHVDFPSFVAFAKVLHQIVRSDRIEEDHVAAANHVVQEMTAAIAMYLVAALLFALGHSLDFQVRAGGFLSHPLPCGSSSSRAGLQSNKC